MRISDWSSDVCSSDLLSRRRRRLSPLGWSSLMQNKRPRAKRRGRRPQRLHGKLLKLNAPRLLALTLPPLRTPKIFVSRSEEHTSELQSLMRISYAVFCLKKKKYIQIYTITKTI